MIFSKQAFLVTILWIVSLTVASLYLWPSYQEIRLLYNSSVEQKDELKKAEDFLEKLDELMSQREELKDQIKNAKNALPINKDLPELITQVASLVPDNGLILNVLNINEAGSANENIKTLLVSVTAKGAYESLKSFIKNLENNLRIMNVSLISFKSPPGEENLMEFKIDFKTYYQ